MTIPIQTPQIGTTGVVQQPGIAEQIAPGLQVVAMALQRRQELELARQQLAQKREEFELHKKIAGTQLEGMQLENEKKKRALVAEEEDLVAQDEALRIFTGGLAQANDMPAWGRIIAGVKDPQVGAHLMSRIQEMAALRGQEASAQGAELKNQQTVLGMAEDRQIHDVIQKLSGRQWNRQTVGQAVGRVVAINPQKAGQVATALNALLPDFQVVLNEDGTVGYAAKEPSDASIGVKPKRPTDEQNKLATYAVRVLEANATMTELENRFPGIGQAVDDRLRAVRALEQVPAVGRPLATGITPSVLRTMTPEARKYANARIDMGNALLRRASGAQINMEELDRETTPYVPVSGQDNSIVPSIQQRRLQQGLLFSEQSGNAFNPNRLSPAARRYLLESIVPNPGYSPDNPFVKRTPGTTVTPTP